MSGRVQPVVPKSVKRKLLKLAHLCVSFGVGVCVVLGIGVWRLSQGPVSLEYVTPVLERTFSVQGTPLAVRVDETLLTWGGWRRFADIRLRNLRLFGPEGKLVALLPDVSVGISLRALLRRRLALSRIEVHGLTAEVERFPDGRFAFGLPVETDGAKPEDRGLQDATAAIMQLVRSREGPLRDLRRFSVVDARLKYIDHVRDKVWDFPQASFAADLLIPGIEAKLAFLLELEGKRTQLAGTLLYDRKSGRTAGRLDFDALRPHLLARAAPELGAISDLGFPVSGNAEFEIAGNLALLGLRLDLRSPVGDAVFEMAYPQGDDAVNAVARLRGLNIAALARSTPALASLAGLDLPVDGRIAGRIAGDGRLHITDVDLSAGAGQIEAPGLIGEPVALNGARLRAMVAPGFRSAEILEARIDLGRTRLNATARVRRVRDEYRVRSAFRLADLTVRDLGRYWPLQLAAGARRWIRENIAAGVIRKGNGDIVLRVPVSAPADATVESVDGSFSYDGLDIRYWSPLPPVTAVGGTATFDSRKLQFTVTEGHLRDVAIERAAVDVSGLDQDRKRIAIELGLRGAARTVLQVLDRPPLRYAARAGIRPDAVSGDAIVQSRIGFPLDETLSEEAIAVKVSARVRNVGLKPAPYGLAVEGGEIAIDADHREFRMTGDVQLGALPVSIAWTETYAEGGNSRQVRLAGRVPDFGRIGFGLPDFDFIAGPGDANIQIRSAPDHSNVVVAEFDLTAAEVSAPYLGWRKPPGTPGRAALRMRIGGAKDFAIEEFRIQAKDTRLEGAAAPTEQGTWRIRIDRFERPESRFAGSIDLHSDRSIVANIRGERFDIAPVLAVAPPVSTGSGRPTSPPRRIRVNAYLDSLSWGSGRRIRQATLSAMRGPQGIEGLMLDGRTGKRGRLSVKYLPGAEGLRLSIRASDFGRALGALLPTGKVAGGSLVIRAHGRAPGAPLRGAFLAKNFVVQEAPTLARLLQVASLTGVVDALSSEGLAFEAFEGDFTFDGGRLRFDKAKAYGSSIGVTLNGDIDARQNRIRLGGTLVPAYTFNRVIGSIPLVGPLLTGGEGEGLFAATYRVTGSLDKPEVSVNPLSVLTPGFLRSLFGGGEPGPPDSGDAGPAKEPN